MLLFLAFLMDKSIAHEKIFLQYFIFESRLIASSVDWLNGLIDKHSFPNVYILLKLESRGCQFFCTFLSQATSYDWRGQIRTPEDAQKANSMPGQKEQSSEEATHSRRNRVSDHSKLDFSLKNGIISEKGWPAEKTDGSDVILACDSNIPRLLSLDQLRLNISPLLHFLL